MSIVLLTILCGCSAPRITETGRSAVEQFLLSTAIDRGIRYADFTEFAGKKVFIEYDYLEPQVDTAYIKGVLEMHLAEQGIIVCRDDAEADIFIQIICGVLATDTDHFMIGSPALPIPIPNTSINMEIPALPVFQKITRKGYSRFSFNLMEAETRQPLKVIPIIDTSAHYTNWTVLFIPFSSNDMALSIQEGATTDISLDY